MEGLLLTIQSLLNVLLICHYFIAHKVIYSQLCVTKFLIFVVGYTSCLHIINFPL